MSDESFMRRCLELAQKPKKDPSPNPRVGAVVVYKNTIVGQGFHERAGKAHAERKAIEDAEKHGFRSFDRASLFVTLEACCHTKKRTPPCLDLILEKKFKRVVFAHKDPNPSVSGRSIKALRRQGIETKVGVLKEQAEAINQAFIKNQKTGLPYVSLKLALSFDALMADDQGNSQWITGPIARKKVHRLREQIGVVAVGKNTIKKDNPSLTTRLGKKENPNRVIVFGKLSNAERFKFAKKNSEYFFVSERKALKEQLEALYKEHHISEILVEGGPRLASSLLAAGTVDRLFLFYGGGLIGGKGRYGLGRKWMKPSLKGIRPIEPEKIELLGSDVLITSRFYVYRTR